MPAKKCFMVKISTGARTPFEATVTMQAVNDELMSVHGTSMRTSEIGLRILDAINKEFAKPLVRNLWNCRRRQERSSWPQSIVEDSETASNRQKP
jgi:hypothetical protein